MTQIDSPPGQEILLTICIATFNRAAWIGETVDALLAQMIAGVELLIVDGASTDDTQAIVQAYMAKHPQIKYRRETSNSGVDRDFDKAVSYACGEYCWLTSDDDVIVPGAIAAVLARLADRPQLVIVNSEIRDKQMSMVLKARQLQIDTDQTYIARDHERFFAETGSYLSFIGAVVVQRVWWLARERAAYDGSLFIHMGVIFQEPAPELVKVVAEPLVRIRYGNALWTARTFEIWIFKWPRLAWSFSHFSVQVRQRVSPRFPASSFKTLLWYRAIGTYGPQERVRLSPDEGRSQAHVLAGVVSRLPVGVVNAALALYCYLSGHGDARMKLYDLARAGEASCLARWLARRSRFPEKAK